MEALISVGVFLIALALWCILGAIDELTKAIAAIALHLRDWRNPDEIAQGRKR